MRKTLLLALSALTMTTAISAAQNAPTKMGDSSKGKVLTDEKGMTLYVFDKDSDGKSTCNGPCAGNWPPLRATTTSSPADGYTVITRDDGSKQWAYKGRPLYAWHNDKMPGDITGDGFLNGAWHIARP
jgi:predicted lipoprotein with Yx(FWY)xxD motif